MKTDAIQKKLMADPEVRRQVTYEFATRSLPGVVCYLIIWLVIILPSGFYREAPFFAGGYAAVLFLLALLRLLHVRLFSLFYQVSPKAWTVSLIVLMFLSGLAWGSICPVVLLMPKYAAIVTAVIISTAGVSAGVSAALAPLRSISLLLQALLLVPGCVLILAGGTAVGIEVGILYIVFGLTMALVGTIQHNEYWTAVHSSYLLRAQALELALLNTVDGLTGVRNRKYFDEEIDKEWKRASREHYPLALMMLDLDHFKQVNDQYGHLMGDECLRTAATVFKNSLKRSTDIVARYGGEEFAVILPNTHSDAAERLAESIRKTLESTAIVMDDQTLHLTVSIGVSMVRPQSGLGLEHLISEADKALYKAKETGRNRVVVAGMLF